MYRLADFSPFAKARREAPRPTIRAACALYFAAVAGLLLTGLLAGLFADIGGARRALNIAFDVGVILIPSLYYLRQNGMGEAARLRTPRCAASLLVVPTAIVGVFFANALGSLWMLLLEALGGKLTNVASPFPTLIESLALGALMPGICEELLCRGVLLSAWERRGQTRALLVSAALFAALHASIEGLPTQFLLGLAIGWIVMATDSLLAGMLYHVVHNACIYLIAVQGTAPQAAQDAALLDRIGGASSVWSLVGLTLLFGAAYAGLLGAFGRLRGRTSPRYVPLDKTPMDTPAFFMLTAALVTAISLYAIAIFAMAGVV